MKYTISGLTCALLFSTTAWADLQVVGDQAEAEMATASEEVLADQPMVTADISVEDPYIHALMPGQHTTAAYMQITNEGDEAIALVGADSPMADRVEIHTVQEELGLIKMREVDSMMMQPGETVTLQPGGFHIMLIDVNNGMNEDLVVPVLLKFSDDSVYQVEAQVKDRPTGIDMEHRHE